ncbi:MAG: LytR C-terminal domain-containing protein [Elusimicrobia bacterium]|nr:LytR C-terminal domain-containing protein [Elusimicrobiota bacterium]
MEQPRGALTLQRALAAAFLTAALCAAAIERRSPLMACVREERPWPFWLAARTAGAVPIVHLGIYHPVPRALTLVRLPEQLRLSGKVTVGRAYIDALRASDDESSAERAVEDLAQEKISSLSLEPVRWEGAGRLTADFLAAEEEENEPAVEVARALRDRTNSPRAWALLLRGAARGLARGDRAAADPLLFALETRRLDPRRLAPALLPEDAAAPSFLARVLGPQLPLDDDRTVVVEVLNATSRPGLAAQASKMLRSKGVDAMPLATAPRSRARTMVYDRTGDFAKAARVREALDCPTAAAATRVDALRGVDVSIEMGEDCADF